MRIARAREAYYRVGSWAALLLILFCSPSLRAAGASFPDHASLATGPWQTKLLPGQQGFVFTMYGAPGDLDGLRRMVSAMREHQLGNGFDPGPAARASSKPLFDYLATVGWPLIAYPGCADMQIQGGRCILGAEDEKAFTEMDRARIFTAVQLGEWGYYFHNLASNESWWREVYGKDFEQFKHLMKPAGLAGYDHRPADRKECYDILKAYFTSRSRDMLNRTISVTGHSHYEAYAAEWGARCIGLELGENIAFTQSKLAFARGASRQWRRPWSVQVSPWFAGACTTSGPLRQEGSGARGLDAGHSLSFYTRLWLHAWFAGAAMVTPENSSAIFFESSSYTLTDHGRKAAEVFRFMRDHERGVAWTPVAIVLDHYTGYNAYMDKAWGILEPTPADREIRDLFDFQLFPGSDHIHHRPDPKNPEASYLRATPYGEMFDVLLSTASPEVLAAYPVILLAGEVQFDNDLVKGLSRALRVGSEVVIAPRHREALGPEFAKPKAQGNLRVLAPWINPATGRNAAIPEEDLRRLAQKYLPVEVTGDAVQYQINRNPGGWVVELINNLGVTKKPDQPASVDASMVASVKLKPRTKCSSALDWTSGRTYDHPSEVRMEVGPGETRFVEFRTR